MMTLAFLHLCDLAFFSSDGKVAIIGIFDQLSVAKFPAIHPRFSVVGGIRDVPKTFELGLRLKTQWKQHPPHDFPIQRVMLPENNPRTHTFLFEITNASFPHPGLYTFEVIANGESVGSIELTVVPAGSLTAGASA